MPLKILSKLVMEKRISCTLPQVPSPLPASGNANHDVARPALAGYHPSVWGDYFISQRATPLKIQQSEVWIRGRVDELVTQVKSLLKNCDTKVQELQLVDSFQRLGIAYHFEEEIGEILTKYYSESIDYVVDVDELHFVSLRFRLLRQHGYPASADVFLRFRDIEGHFKAHLKNDVRGLLSLYEAAYLSIHGEQILDDFASFARKHLQSMESNVKPTLAMQISNSLRCPLRRRMERLEARNYIDIYQEDEHNRNDLVLELAKCNFHLLQLLHREEVKSISEWWKELGLTEKLTFARDRVVECYFWILGVYFEPHYSRARLIVTKMFAMFSLIDDIYDDYGTVEELRVYTEQIQRWDLDGLDQLNESLRLQYIALYDTVKDIENELVADQMSYRVDYLKEAVKRNCKAWFKEAEWREASYIPTFEEHLTVSLVTSCYTTLACISFVGMSEIATKQAFDWILGRPKISEAACTVGRLINDLVSMELEQKREHVASTIQSYMKEHGASLQEACDRIKQMAEDAWKEMNQECLKEKTVSMHLLMRIINLARMIEMIYEDYDSYTHSDMMLKDNIAQLLVQPIIL